MRFKACIGTSRSSWCIHDIIQIRRRGILAVALTAERFAPLALAQREMLGIDLPIIFLPDPLPGRDPVEIVAIADRAYPELLAALVRDPS